MAEKIKPVLEKAKTFLKKVPKKLYLSLVVLLVAALAIVVFLHTRPYEILFTDLKDSEMSSILSYLDESGFTEYQVEGDDTILVPASQEAGLKARLLMAGYPQSGFAYTYTAPSGTLSTESERAEAALHELEAKLSSVVRNFEGVKDASVNINPGENRGYVLDSNRVINATASVFVALQDSSRQLGREQADAIRNLIAHSVKGLEFDSVMITDEAGNTYAPSDEAADAEASALKMRLEQENANKIRTEVLRTLTPYFGEENVRVAVNCTVDVSRTVENNTDVYLPDWAADGSTNGRGIVGSRIYNYVVVRDDEETAGGTVGTTTNADLPEYVEDLPELNGTEDELNLSGQVDYDNSRSEKQIVRTAGYLTDCMISVSINSRVAGSVNYDELQTHVARAAGIVGPKDPVTGKEILDDKISVMALPFYDPAEEMPGLEPVPGFQVETWMIVTAGVAAALLLVLLVVLLLLKKKKKKKLAKQLAAAQAAQAAQAASAARDVDAILAAAGDFVAEQDTGADVMSLQTERSMELRQDIRKFAEENPEIAAQMIKSWLRGDDDNG